MEPHFIVIGIILAIAAFLSQLSTSRLEQEATQSHGAQRQDVYVRSYLVAKASKRRALLSFLASVGVLALGIWAVITGSKGPALVVLLLAAGVYFLVSAVWVLKATFELNQVQQKMKEEGISPPGP